MENEHTEYFAGFIVRHGALNSRVYLTLLDRDAAARSLGNALEYAHELVALHNYSKILVTIPAQLRQNLEQENYEIEAIVPKLYNAREDALFMARYFHPDRLIDHAADRVQKVLETAKGVDRKTDPLLPSGCECRLLKQADCTHATELYQQLFPAYQAPLGNPQHLSDSIAGNHFYAGIWKQGTLLAVASAEFDLNAGKAEMSGFATHIEYQGQGFAKHLLRFLEKELSSAGINTGYTLARAPFFGMNIVAAQLGYQYGGTLVKNEKYAAGLESMNLWYKAFDANCP